MTQFSSLLQRDIPVPSLRFGLSFPFEKGKGLNQTGAGVFRKNDLIDISQFRSLERACKTIPVFIDQLCSGFLFVFCLSYLFLENNIYSPLRPHNGDLSCGVSEINISPMVLTRHNIIGPSVGLACYNRYFRHSRFTVGINDFRPMLDNAAVFLGCTRHEARHIDQRYDGNVECIAKPYKPGFLV